MLRRASVGLATLAVVLATASGAPARADAPTVSGNLIVDGDAEAGMCTTDARTSTTVPGWTVDSGDPQVQCYGNAGFGRPAAPAPGQAFFTPTKEGSVLMEQTANVAAAQSAIDGGGVQFTLSGWLGGWSSYDGNVRVALQFKDQGGAQLGTADLPSGADSSSQSFVTRSLTGLVPAGTRSIRVLVTLLDPSWSNYTGFLDNLSLTLNTPLPAAVLTPPPSQVPAYDHVFVITMENTDYAELLGSSRTLTPFLHSMMDQGALLTDYHAVEHPSDPNYLAMAGGDGFMHGGTYAPKIHDPNTNLADKVEAKGKTWKEYQESMGTPCKFYRDGSYWPDDGPFLNYDDIVQNNARCVAHVVDQNQLNTDLASASTTPNFSWIAANDDDDGEGSGDGNDKSLKTQNDYLQATLQPILASPAWTQQRSLIIVNWDETETEYDGKANQVAALVMGSQNTVAPGTVDNTRYDHFSVPRTIEQALGIDWMTPNDEYATPFNGVFAPIANPVPNSTLAATTPVVTSSDNLAFQYFSKSINADPNNSVALYLSGTGPGPNPVARATAGQPFGEADVSTTSLAPNTYDAYYLNSAGATLAGPIKVTVQAPGTLTLATPGGAPTITAGQNLPVQYATIQATASSSNWVAVYIAGTTPPSSHNYQTYAWASGTNGSQSVPTNTLPTGSYTAWYLNSNYVPLAAPIPFTITAAGGGTGAPTPTDTLTAVTQSVAWGSPATVQYTVAPADVSTSDQLAIFPVDAKPGSTPASSTYITDAGNTVNLPTNRLPGPGNYNIYLLAKDGQTPWPDPRR
ncbi:alkaline phosphatase family protein [Kitasatospora sp. LaBMicrA B282]|uniref:alkaline phosphatase family protein n=1 Tax=Kitasatospora sp. LaBMicrA B282 TaxID=3420949 RepID=UPI003D12307B